jgi:pimeloyl-ACP methyl ester carboxylesterase
MFGAQTEGEDTPMSMSKLGRGPRWIVAATIVAGALTLLASGPAAADGPKAAPTPRPTVVLVHGAWADSSAWSGVVRRLQSDGYHVDAFPTPLRSLSGDAASLRQFLDTIDGPIVLVGHSYGGAVVTDAATGNSAVQALVYIDAFAPEAGESVFQLAGPDSVLANPDPTQVFNFVPNVLPPTPTTDLYVKQSVFPKAFANDLPRPQGRVLAATQRPATFGALVEPSTAPAWKTIPSWYEVGTIDRVIPASAQQSMAQRAGAHIVTQRTGHLPMISAPGAVTGIVETAARATA